MVRVENRLVLAGGVLIAVITSCVQLPDIPAESTGTEPAASVTTDNRTGSRGAGQALPEASPSAEPQAAGEESLSAGDTSLASAGPPSANAPEAGEGAEPEPAPPAVKAGPEPEPSAQEIGTQAALPVLPDPVAGAQSALALQQVEKLCEQIGNKLGSVSVQDCLRQDFHFGGGFSINQRPLMVKELPPERHDAGSIRIFLMGGIHGDEYSSISIIFKWLELFSPYDPEGKYYWRFAPLVNPDGLLDGQARRQNANGVDLNRNFPSLDWNAHATDYWQDKTGRNPRRFPGDSAASEPEVQWIVQQIEEFDPDVIVSVHAPYHLLDFDGPSEAPEKIGELYLHQLGVYPGSLGNYAGLDKNIPVVTLELPSAGILPTPDQIRLMWLDLVAWLEQEGSRPETN